MTRIPLIIDEEILFDNFNNLEFLFKSVFDNQYNNPEVQELLNIFVERGIYGSHDQILQNLKLILLEKLDLTQTYTAQRILLTKYLNKIIQHEIMTLECQTSYDPRQKSNPYAVFWTNPQNTSYPTSIYNTIPYANKFPIIDKTTPIGSAGSCFAMEIANYLQDNGYNYVKTEPNHISSARWGILFNAPSFRQIVERSFGLRELPKVLSQIVIDGEKRLYDPFRDDVFFHSIEEYEADYNKHIEASRQALLKAEVFVLTLGMNEIWELKADGSVFSRSPWRIGSFAVRPRILTVEENIQELQRMLDIWRAYNNSIKLIVTVSPVPLHGSFRGNEHHVIAANLHSKSILRVAVEEFTIRNKDVFYFPSYETVLFCTENPWDADQRHVSREAVGKVMQTFQTIFVKDRIDEKLENTPNSEEYYLKLMDVSFTLSQIDESDLAETEKKLNKQSYFQEIFAEIVRDWAVNEEIQILVNHEQFLSILDVFNQGYEYFLKNSQTPPESFQAMRLLYFLTDGAFNNFWVSLYGLFHLPYDLNTAKEFLMPCSKSKSETIAKEIQDQGYYVFEDKVPSDICERLLDFAYSTPCNINIHDPSQAQYEIYQIEQPKATTYHIEERQLIENPIIQDLISDRFILEVAQSYCGCSVTNANVSMWWSTNFSNSQPSSLDAQLYHWDGDQIKFLKFFIYLTDVDTNNGPHCYVKGSHTTKPTALLRDGRFLDEEIEKYYDQDQIIEIAGSRGTIIAADTRGFHKGKPVQSGHRLILQVTMATCLFGALYNSINLKTMQVTPSLMAAYQDFPDIYQRFHINP
ncbi:GSCFA domain-containing protein [Anabaena catenula]|uniref:GSCFA domain-containing protein n=1 Tax=Anabaena catenula FACHB-362 TaxID=2692877 RepID=A0ABR8J0C1_9NOST|nr:GSCFA domain-containing protein [Anabaena catenula]MBD2691078.1 GSCFA domain-containing protein [Anabaena catenula FACHB-362]